MVSLLYLYIFTSSLEIIWYKTLALSIVYQKDKFEGNVSEVSVYKFMQQTTGNVQEYFKSLLGSLQKPVLYAVNGTTSQLLYRCMLLFCQMFGEHMKEDVERYLVYL